MHDCIALPGIGTRGGAAIFWNRELVSVVSQALGIYSIMSQVTVLSCSSQFLITTIYGPSDDTNKYEFLVDLVRCAPPSGAPWLINDNFNVIYEARDKSNLNLSRIIMGRFRSAIDTAEA